MQPQQLGCSRTCLRNDHFFQAPDSFVRAPLPGMTKGTAIVHVGPALGAQFTEYTAELTVGGTLGFTNAQRFVYVVSGTVRMGDATLNTGDFGYVPEGELTDAVAASDSVLLVIEKPFQPADEMPGQFSGTAASIQSEPLMGDADVQVQALVPAAAAFDFAVNLMTFVPGASLSIVESHVMEHGLMMLQGGGIYKLGDSWYPIMAGDFIWMAPYCPQWFGAIGKTPAQYLIYKDWNRHPL